MVTTLKGTTFRVAENSPDMYASIDLVANRLVSNNVDPLDTTTWKAFEPNSYNRSHLLVYLFFQARKLRKYKERRLDGYHGGPNMGENLADALNSVEVDESTPDNEQYIDPEQTVVTKVKRCVVSSHCSLN